MSFKPIFAGILVGVLSASCTQGHKQYEVPADQRKSSATTKSDLKIPANPSSPGAGLVPGQFTDLTQEELDQRNEEIARKPILFTQGMGGVTRFQNKSEIEKILGTQGRPIASPYGTYYLFPSKVLVFYLTGSENPYFLAALPGYLGTLTIFDNQQIGLSTDMRPLFGNDPKAFTRKLYNHFAQKPEGEDCKEKCLFNTYPTYYTVDLQDFGSITVDKDTLKVQQFTITRREVDPAKIAGDFDVFGQEILGETSIKIGDTFGDLESRGGLQTIKEDFSRGIDSFSLSLANGISFSIERNDSRSSYVRPASTEKLQAVFTSGSFQGAFILNNKLLSIVPLSGNEAPDEENNSFDLTINGNGNQTPGLDSDTKKFRIATLDLETLPAEVLPLTASWRALLSQVLTTSPAAPTTVSASRAQVTDLLRVLINVTEKEAKSAYPESKILVSRINGQMNEAYDATLEASVSIVNPNDFSGKVISFQMSVNEPDLSVSTYLLNNKISSVKPYKELLASNDFSFDIQEGGQQGLGDFSIGTILSLDVLDSFYKYSSLTTYGAQLVDGKPRLTAFSTLLAPYAENVELKVANSVSGQVSSPAGFTAINTWQVYAEGTLLYLMEVKSQELRNITKALVETPKGTLFKVVAVQSTVQTKGAKVKNTCFDGKVYKDLSLAFGSSDQLLLNSLTKNNCQYMIDPGTANLKSIPAFYLPKQGIQLIMSENVLTDIMYYDVRLTTAQ